MASPKVVGSNMAGNPSDAHEKLIDFVQLDTQTMESWFPTGLTDEKTWKGWYGSLDMLSAKSDFLRYTLLYKFGGTYVDTDVIVRKGLTGLKNTIGLQGKDFVNQAVMVFEKGSDYIRNVLSLIRER
jgi:hypothetical protein